MTHQKKMTLIRIHFHIIVLEPIYSDIRIFLFKTKSTFLLQTKGVVSSEKLKNVTIQEGK